MFRMRAARASYFVISAKASPRHPGVGRDPVPFFHSGETFHFVIPAKAGIHLLLSFGVDAKTDSRPCGVPSAILAAGSLSLLAQRK
jgi:hypothetical protein